MYLAQQSVKDIVIPFFVLFSTEKGRYFEKGMGRKKNLLKPQRLPLTLIEPARKRLERLVNTGGYGNSATDAARTIIMLHLHGLDAQKKINLFDDLPPLGNADKR